MYNFQEQILGIQDINRTKGVRTAAISGYLKKRGRSDDP